MTHRLFTMPKLQWPGSTTSTRITLALKSTAIMAATIILFHQDFALLFSDALQDKTTSYVLAVPFILFFLIYRKRKMLRTVMPLSEEQQFQNVRSLSLLTGILMASISILLYWYDTYTSTGLEYHMLALPMFTAGLCLILFNSQTLRQLAFPIAFLVFLMPLPREMLRFLGSAVQVVSVQASSAIVNAFSIPTTLTYQNGSPTITVTTPNGTGLPVPVDLASLGIYSLVGFTLFAVFVAYITREKPWKKAALIMTGIPIIYLLSMFKTTTILFAGYSRSDLIFQSVYLPGDWMLILTGTLVLLVAYKEVFNTKILAHESEFQQYKFAARSDEDFCRQCSRILRPASTRLGTKDVAKLISVILVVSILLAIQSPFLVLARGPSTVVITTSSGEYFSGQVLPNQSQYSLTFMYENQNYEALTKQDLSLNYLYTPINGSSEQILATLEIASVQSDLRNWETYVLSWPQSYTGRPRATQIEARDVVLASNPPVASRFFVFEYTDINQIQAVLYWNETVNFMTNSIIQQKYVEISLIALLSSTEELARVKNTLTMLATVTADYWQPLTNYSEATLIVIQNGLLLLAFFSTVLAATIIYYKVEAGRRKRSSQSAIEKLNKSDRDVLKAVQKTKQPATLENIARTLQETSPETIMGEELWRRLRELEKTRMVRASTYNLDDEPLRIWKI